MKHSIKAVLFDLDDTLWPIVPVIRRAENLLQEWLKEHAPAVAQRFTVEQQREMRMVLMASDPLYQVDLARLRHEALVQAFQACGLDSAPVAQAMRVFSRARNEVQPWDDVLPVLSRLRTRVKLGSITNGVADLTQIGMAGHFHYSIAAFEAGCAKPDPQIFLTACRALSVAPQETLYIGDDPLLDVEGAQKAGMLGGWMTRPGLEFAKKLPSHVVPDAQFSSLHALEEWLAVHI